MSRSDDDLSTGSILRELIVNQYQAILLGGVALASALTVSPLPLLLWAGAELVLLPVLDSGPLRRLVSRKRREKLRAQEAQRRAALVASFNSANARRYQALENLCRMIEANYQGLTGISQAYLSEQRGKLDHILEGCVTRMLALQRYEKMPHTRDPYELRMDIAALEHEVKDTDLNDRARAALVKNLELKRRLLESYSEVGGTMRALETELDSMASLLEVLHQNSISLRDPQAIAEELDTIVEQSEHSEKVVREMEALLRSDAGAWTSPDSTPITPTRGATTPGGRSRQKETRR
jgi:signal transduction histidine kinase